MNQQVLMTALYTEFYSIIMTIADYFVSCKKLLRLPLTLTQLLILQLLACEKQLLQIQHWYSDNKLVQNLYSLAQMLVKNVQCRVICNSFSFFSTISPFFQLMFNSTIQLHNIETEDELADEPNEFSQLKQSKSVHVLLKCIF